MPKEYVEYSVKHLYELIDKYHPSVLWNDIAFPYGYNLNELFAHYYNTVEDGVIDDRWNQRKVPKTEEEWQEVERRRRGRACGQHHHALRLRHARISDIRFTAARQVGVHARHRP